MLRIRIKVLLRVRVTRTFRVRVRVGSKVSITVGHKKIIIFALSHFLHLATSYTWLVIHLATGCIRSSIHFAILERNLSK